MSKQSALRSSLMAVLAVLAWSSLTRAQSPPPATPDTQPAFSTSISGDQRPTTTTFLGDTGIWYVPTAEVLRSGTWSVGGDRRGTNYVQGLSNVADFTGSAAVGLGNRTEVFGAFLVDTRINRRTPPVFENDARQGGIVARFPRVNQSWTGDSVGDLYLGTKINLLSEYREAPVALAVRGIVKLPTGNDGAGVSTGRTDVMADVIVSKEIARFVETAIFAGYEVRGTPSGLATPAGSYRWGTGVTFPSRSPLRISAEANGDLPTSYRATLTDNSVVGVDGSLRPFESDIRNRTRATGGLTYQMPAGFYMGTGLSWNAPRYWDWQMRLGYHGRSRHQARSLTVAPEGAATLPAAPLSDPVDAPRAKDEASSMAPAPTPLALPVAPAPLTPPLPPVTIAPTTYAFEDVYFDFDGYTPRPSAKAGLEAVVAAMTADPTLALSIEGHTCNIGTSEYNVGLGDRRAAAVRDYIVSRGVATSRLRTASYGEESPEHANAHEATRRLNRHVALVARLQR